MRSRRPLVNLGLALASSLVALALGEGLLRALDYRFSPVAFVTPDNANDFRAFHMRARDPRVSRVDPLTLFDLDLLWKLNPKASREVSSQGFRGAVIPEPKRDVFLILAIGDSNTVGSLASTDHWPGFLEDLLKLNAAGRPIQVINAGVYGYSSFQGLRLFKQALRFEPDLVTFSFGANDATPVRTSDADYALRIESLARLRWSRTAPLLAHLGWRISDAITLSAHATPRVSLSQFQSNLEEYVSLAQSHGVKPVLLTRPYRGSSQDPGHWMSQASRYRAVTLSVARERGIDCVDVFEAFKNAPEAFVDESHFSRLGNRRMAELLLPHLKAAGVVATERGFSIGTSVDLASAGDRTPELGGGWWGRERWADGRAGRWTSAAAVLVLDRRRGEKELSIDLSCQSPADRTVAEVHVNGTRLDTISSANGRVRRILDLGAISGEQLTVRFVVERPFVPRLSDPSNLDARELGIFVHAVGLLPSAESRSGASALEQRRSDQLTPPR